MGFELLCRGVCSCNLVMSCGRLPVLCLLPVVISAFSCGRLPELVPGSAALISCSMFSFNKTLNDEPCRLGMLTLLSTVYREGGGQGESESEVKGVSA